VEDIPFEYYKEFTPRFEKRKTRIKLKSLPEFLKIPTKPLEDWEELKEGDYVVHKDYGIGKFIGIKKITNQFGTKEYFELLYSNNTKLYVPVERMHRLHRYIGNVEEIKLGNLSNTSNWERTKKKAREEIEKKVQELLKIYALRLKMTKKPSLGDQELESRFFESFPHVETEDQLKVTEEILNDMADIKPMDRLLCGDSGAGKTEVAMRAAFRAVVSGKQVAFLVPTTILAKQHYLNFKDRMEKFGVKIEFLDRLKTSKEIEKILKELENGSIDIIIGTHRLLSKDVKLKNLGLVIIDEEHRFGVAQKEKLKKHRLTVDVLSLSATPIPRTLYMSLSGIRDISVIKTLPPGRVPVEIIVSKYDQRIVKTAILREISRGGQVLYVHNRVRDLDDVLLKLREMFPDLKIDIAHGQMSKRHFDRVISDFYDGKLDVLISTTIVENGVDVPNANTLIVDDAHRYGLAQLYQIRGRVGRGNRRAFAYFLYPSNLKLKNEAAERLNAIREFGKPGGGFKLSLKDMEIRGIGNVFGFEQHGHINAIGLYMYREMLENVLKKYRGDETLNELEENIIDVELKGFKMDVLIPQDYIPDSLERMKIYRKIAQSRNCDEINDIEKELRDRFGKIPDSVFNLLDYARIRIMASKYGVNRISLENSTLKFGFEEEEQARNVYKIITNGTVLDGELIIYNFHFKEPVKKLLEILSKLQKEVIDCSIQ
jgi:transcription-repair coupling factor (superfamily II helicase)